MTTQIVRRADRHRYELVLDGEHAGHVTWFMRDGVTVLDHTLIRPAFGGQGLGSVLARGALDQLRASGRPFAVDCPFLRGWVAKHSDYADVPLWVWPDESAADEAG